MIMTIFYNTYGIYRTEMQKTSIMMSSTSGIILILVVVLYCFSKLLAGNWENCYDNGSSLKEMKKRCRK